MVAALEGRGTSAAAAITLINSLTFTYAKKVGRNQVDLKVIQLFLHIMVEKGDSKATIDEICAEASKEHAGKPIKSNTVRNTLP